MLHKYMGKTSLKGGTPIETLRFICSLHMGDDYILWFFTNVSCQFIPGPINIVRFPSPFLRYVSLNVNTYIRLRALDLQRLV